MPKYNFTTSYEERLGREYPMQTALVTISKTFEVPSEDDAKYIAKELWSKLHTAENLKVAPCSLRCVDEVAQLSF